MDQGNFHAVAGNFFVALCAIVTSQYIYHIGQCILLKAQIQNPKDMKNMKIIRMIVKKVKLELKKLQES